MNNTVVELESVTVKYKDFYALRGLSLRLDANGIYGIIGPNGAGKTTLLNTISGFAEVTSGVMTLNDEDITHLAVEARVKRGIVRGFQQVRLLERESILDNVVLGAQLSSQTSLAGQILGSRKKRKEEERHRARAYQILDTFGLQDEAHMLACDAPFATKRLVEIARIIMCEPQVMILDEPAAGLDPESRASLSETLVKFHQVHGAQMVIVEHDMGFVSRTCDYVVALTEGSVLCHGEPQMVLADAELQHAYFGFE